MFKKGILFIALCLFTFKAAWAQKAPDFSSDPKIFAGQMKDFFDQDKHPETAEIMDNFQEQWVKKNAFTASEQGKIMDQVKFMAKLKLKVYPEFTSYVRLLNTYKNSKIDEARLDKYHEIGQKLLNKSKKDFKDYNGSVELLFSELAIFKSAAKEWKVSNDAYQMDFTTEPVFIFPKIELQLYTKADTLGIYQTGGKFYPLTNKWVGNGGLVYWTRVGFSKDRAYAKLKNYKIDVKNSEYRADSVYFTFPKIFAKPILGKLEDKATTEYLGIKASFPRFQSYQNIFTINNVFKNVDYRGGFALEGPQILGTGNDTSRAVVTIRQNGKVLCRALSKAFVIAPDRISALKTSVSIYIDKDSIYHSQIIFSYIDKNRTLTLSRDNIGLYTSPFFDSYHQFEFGSGNILWNIDSNNVYLKTIANPGNASEFESSLYYAESKYLVEQGVLDYNPLERLKRLTETNKTRNFTEQELAANFNTKPEYLSSLLFQLATEGYIFYDFDGHTVSIKDKLIHYVGAAVKNEDYDIIKFQSIISKLPNAAFNLKNYDMIVQGVPRLNISDSQNTYVIPTEQTITIKKNRDMKFVGQVHSGRFDFYGKDMYFDYAKFKVTLNNLDSVKFKFPEYNKEGKEIGLRTVQNTIQNVNGFLYIDEPGNKSGKKRNPEYPIFECNRESFVYYDKKQIYNKIYNRKTFFFKIDPFVIKKLGTFTAQGLQFPGSFTSADILPVIKNSLTIQEEDYSLGFITNSPEAGYPLYKGKGKGKATFKLSNKGLRGDGEVAYLDSKMKSDNFIFFPDSMNSQTQQFEIPQIAGGKYPPIAGKDLFNHWKPYNDSLYIIHGKIPLSVYLGKIDFSGNLVLTPQELVGIGNLKYQNLNISSNAFAFLPRNIKTNDGNLDIKTESGNRSAVTARNITADIDLAKDFGKFHTNQDTSQVALPSNRFSTTLNNFTYDIKGKEVNFAKGESQSEDNAYFISSNPEQQELKFNSGKATFNIDQQKIKAEDVPYLKIADSKIYTPNKELQIEKEGNISGIKGAEIVAEAESQNHRIYNAFVNIFGKNKFTGYGDIDYFDKNDKKFKISLNDIRVDELGRTIAKGEVRDTAKFFLTPGIRFSGMVNLLSIRKELYFDGYALPEHKIAGLRSEWVKMSDTIDPKLVVLNIKTPVGRDGHELFTGTFVSSDTAKIYNVLFARKKNAGDLPVFTTTGLMIFDEKDGEYLVGPRVKVLPEAGDAQGQQGNLFKAIPAKKQVYTEGTYDFGAELKDVEVKTAGEYTYNYKDSTNLFNVVMLVDFPLHEDVYKIMLDTLQDEAPILNDVENSKNNIYDAFATLIKNKKDREKVVGDLTNGGTVTNVDETNKLFVFTEVKLTYFDTSRSFVSKGEIGLANSEKTIINKRYKGVIEVRKSYTGDKFSMIIGGSNGGYHYFTYKGGVLGYQSSDYIFTDKVKETEPKFRKAHKGIDLRLATVREVMQLFKKSRRK